MKRIVVGLVATLLTAGMGVAWAHEGHEVEAANEQTLTGEVMDVFCYLSHGEQGQGKDHVGCAKKCIESGLPVAIKVGDQLYLATMADHTSANNTLAPFAGEQVTVHGAVMEKDGQHLIAIEHVEKTK